jgi:hypothetical protein
MYPSDPSNYGGYGACLVLLDDDAVSVSYSRSAPFSVQLSTTMCIRVFHASFNKRVLLPEIRRLRLPRYDGPSPPQIPEIRPDGADSTIVSCLDPGSPGRFPPQSPRRWSPLSLRRLLRISQPKCDEEIRLLEALGRPTVGAREVGRGTWRGSMPFPTWDE